MAQIVLLCHGQLWVLQLGSLRGEAGCPDVDLPLICPAQGFLLALGQPGFGTWIWLRYVIEPQSLAASPLQCWAQNAVAATEPTPPTTPPKGGRRADPLGLACG